MKKILVIAVLMVAYTANAENEASHAPLDVDDVESITITRGPSGRVGWEMRACTRVVGAVRRKGECNSHSGILGVAPSNTLRNFVKSNLLPAFCAEHQLTCAP